MSPRHPIPLVVFAALLVALPARPQDCIDYQDYLHWADAVRTDRPVVEVAISGDHAYLTDYDGLHIVDVTEPTSLEVVGAFQTSGAGEEISVDGNIVAISTTARWLYLFDVSDPTDPVEIGRTTFELEPDDIELAGDYLYYTGAGNLHVLGVADPASIEDIGTIETPGDAGEVAVAGSRAYITDGLDAALRIYDVSDPGAAVLLGSVTIAGLGLDVAVSGSHAFVSTTQNLMIVDVSEPALPDVVGLAYVSANRVAAMGSWVFTTGFNRTTMSIVDVTEPTAPIVTGSLESEATATSVAASNEHVAVASGIVHVAGITNPVSPPTLGSFGSTHQRDVFVFEQRVYRLDRIGRLSIADVSDPLNVVFLGSMDVPGEGSKLYVPNRHALVATLGRGLYIVDVVNPGDPIPRGVFDLAPNVRDVKRQGDLAYLAAEDWGLLIVNVFTTAEPTLVGGVTADGPVYGVDVRGDYAYLAIRNELNGFGIVDVRDPEVPVLVGSVLDVSVSGAVTVDGDHAYVGSEAEGVVVVNIADPTSPHVVGSVYVGGDVNEMAVNGNVVYVADRTTGLHVLDVSTPSAPVARGSISGQGGAYGVALGEGFVVGGGPRGYWLAFDQCDDFVPVHLLSFTARAIAGGVELTWRVGSETGIAGYRVFRSVAGYGERPIADVMPVGDSGPASYRVVDPDAAPGRAHAYRLAEVTAGGESTLGSVVVHPAGAPDVVVGSPSPNPFNPVTRLTFELPSPGTTTVRVWDAQGRLVRALAERWLEAGSHAVTWDGRDSRGRDAASGTYYLMVSTPGRVSSRSVALIR